MSLAIHYFTNCKESIRHIRQRNMVFSHTEISQIMIMQYYTMNYITYTISEEMWKNLFFLIAELQTIFKNAV